MTVYGFKTIRNVSFLAKFGPFLALAGAVLLMIPWPFCISVRLPNQITVSKSLPLITLGPFKSQIKQVCPLLPTWLTKI